jgi:hypothetical protein
MPSWRKLFVFAAFLPGLAAAADPAMLDLIMPDARFVVDINVARLVSSPIGQAMSAQMKNEVQSLHPDWQQTMMGLSIDWTRFAQEVVIAGTGGAGKDAPALVIVRGLLDPAWIESLPAFRGAKSVYQGVPILSSTNGNSVLAFVDGSIAVIGQAADVKAAIRRRGQNTPPPAVLADGLHRFEGQYDAWMVSAGKLSAPKAATGASMQWLDHMDAFAGGVRLSPDFEISADITMRNEKDVADMASGMRWFGGVVQTQAQGAGGLDKMNFKVDGRRLTFSLEVPEQEVRAALQQRQTGQNAPARRPAVHPPDITSGLPDPPSGTIRIQSSPSDMGTVLMPVDKHN